MYASNLKAIRKKLRYSISEMASVLEIPARTLGGYERHERTPSVELVSQLYNKLNINANWFISGKGEMFNQNMLPDEKTKDFIHKEVRRILKDEGVIK